MKPAAIALFGALAFYLLCVNFVDSTDAAIARNRISGEVSLQSTGWHVTPPWVAVSVVDVRPVRVCVSSSGRDVGCRLVRFRSEAYREFVQTEGFRYWWWANRISFNGGYNDEYRGMKDLMRGYAFSGLDYPFLDVQREFGGK